MTADVPLQQPSNAPCQPTVWLDATGGAVSAHGQFAAAVRHSTGSVAVETIGASMLCLIGRGRCLR